MLDESWIKLYRKLRNWEWYGDSDTKSVFIELLLTANVKPRKFEGVYIDRGEVVTSIKSLSEILQISPQRVRTCLKRLEKSKVIFRKSTNRFTVISVCRYSEFQNKEIESNKQPTSNQQATNNTIRKEERKSIYSGKKPLSYPDEFNSLWKYYKENQHPESVEGEKKKAYLKYQELIKHFDHEIIKKHTEHYLKKCNERDSFTKHFSTFLNQHDFSEDIEEERQSNVVHVKFGNEVVEVQK